MTQSIFDIVRRWNMTSWTYILSAKMVHFCKFLKTWSLRSNSVTRQVSLNRTKIGRKMPKFKNSNASYWVIFKHWRVSLVIRDTVQKLQEEDDYNLDDYDASLDHFIDMSYKRKSEVWKHFLQSTSWKICAKCRHCDKIMLTKKGSTSALMRHLITNKHI